MRLAALPCLAVLAAAPLAAQAPDAGAVLDGAVVALGRATTLRADFTQYLRDPMVGTSDTSSGELLREAPGKFGRASCRERVSVVV